MSTPGASDLLVRARTVLLDALIALEVHRESVVVIGAQAIYLHTGSAQVALAETTKDSDLALDARSLGAHPLLEAVMRGADFIPDPASGQPGSWINPAGIPVDLMVPDALAGQGGRRGARIPPHDRRATRRAIGLEAAMVDNSEMEIRALTPLDQRVVTARVAGPAALLVAKLHKLGERQVAPHRQLDKDAHDLYRILIAIPTPELASVMRWLADDQLAGSVTRRALAFLSELFAAGASAPGSAMAGRAEEGIGNPEIVSASAAVLAGDLLAAVAAFEK